MADPKRGVDPKAVETKKPEEAKQAPEKTGPVLRVDRTRQDAKAVFRELGKSDDKEWAEKMTVYQDDIDDLLKTDPKKLGPEKAYAVSEAMSVLLNQMDNEIPAEGMDPDIARTSSVRAKKSREIFRAGCEKLFPDVDVSNTDLGVTKIQILAETLREIKADDTAHHVENLLRVKEKPGIRKTKKDTGLLRDIDEILQSAGLEASKLIHAESGVDLSKEEKTRLGKLMESSYVLLQLQDMLRKDFYGDADPKDYKKIDEAREAAQGRGNKVHAEKKEAEKKEEEPAITFDEAKKILNESKAKTVAEIQALVSPEMKRVLLAKILLDIDDRIQAAKKLFPKKDTLLGVSNMGQLESMGARMKAFGFPLVAAEKAWISGDEVAAMKVPEYLKRAFGYDLKADTKRRKDLEERTSIFL